MYVYHVLQVQSGIKLFADSLSSLSPLPIAKRKMKSKLTPQTVSTESSEGSDADLQDSNSSSSSGSESSVDDADSDVVDSAATTALKALQTIRDDFLAQIAEMDLPGNPLDLLVDQLGGPNAVAEMTGR
jgi:3-oxoacyl-ACP reductase-like protein